MWWPRRQKPDRAAGGPGLVTRRRSLPASNARRCLAPALGAGWARPQPLKLARPLKPPSNSLGNRQLYGLGIHTWDGERHQLLGAAVLPSAAALGQNRRRLSNQKRFHRRLRIGAEIAESLRQWFATAAQPRLLAELEAEGIPLGGQA